jgi:L-malate glycosyltransferase
MNACCVRQMTANLAYADAVTNDVLEIDRRLRAWGCRSEIYAESAEPRLGPVSKPSTMYERYLARTEDVLLFHYSIYSATLDQYRRSKNKKLVVYNNVTPPEYFRGFDPQLESLCRLGRDALPALADCDFALAASEFNRQELIRAGVPEERAGVRPISLDLTNLTAAQPNKNVAAQVKAAASLNLLFVGRLAPNKRCEDLLKLLYLYRKEIDPGVHLWLVGNRSFTTYVSYLEALTGRLKLLDAVTFADRVSRSDLRAYYESCDVFVSASCHEGFGVPLVESMQFGLPVLARAAAATPETLGGAGVMVSRWQLPDVAEAVRRIACDEAFRARLIDCGRARAAELAATSGESTLRQALVRLRAL